MNANSNQTSATAEAAKIKAEYKSLGKLSIVQLRQQYQISHRVCSLSGIDRWTLIAGIMEARHGAKRQAAFAKG